MLGTQFPPWPSFTAEEAEAVSAVLRSNRVNYWTGEECRNFEREFAAWTEAKYAVALTNGTVALEVALEALNIGPGDEVIVTPRTFIASVSCVIRRGAHPVFADVDLRSGNVTAESVEPMMTQRTKAIICVHLGGWPCEMDDLLALADARGVHVIEDCAQAHGATYRGRHVGTMGCIGAWSFCQDKIITTGGEGGMVTTNDRALWSTMWSIKDHGKAWDAVYNRQHPRGYRWLHESIGTNGRMIEMQAAIGRIQLNRITDWSEQRRRNLEAIWSFAEGFPALRVERPPKHCVHAGYRAYVYVILERLRENWSRDRIVDEINSRGVPCFTGSCSEVYLENALISRHVGPATSLPNARQLGETSIAFLIHPTLGESEIARTNDAMSEVLNMAAHR